MVYICTMINFTENAESLQNKIDSKTKPIGSLGLLERLAFQIGNVQKTCSPQLLEPTIVVFAGDHGIAKEGISAYPSDVTAQMVLNFLNGGAAINVFCRQNAIHLQIVDSGVDFDFNHEKNLIDAKIAKGTQSFLNGNAMTEKQLQQCFQHAEKIVDSVAATGCNVIGFGEMGIGNTAAASMLMSYLCRLPLEQCVGRGTGLNDDGLQHKLAILSQAQRHHGQTDDAMMVLQKFAGFEMSQITAAMLHSFRHNMLILVDGFIATASFLAAYKINPAISTHSIFCHQSDERGHQLLLNYLKATPILQLNLRLGEGTGCALAYPIIKNAVGFLNEMHSFESANVSRNFEAS